MVGEGVSSSSGGESFNETGGMRRRKKISQLVLLEVKEKESLTYKWACKDGEGESCCAQ